MCTAMLQMPDPSGPMAIASSLSSVNARLFAFAKQLKGRGHQILIAGPDELDQVRWQCGPGPVACAWTVCQGSHALLAGNKPCPIAWTSRACEDHGSTGQHFQVCVRATGGIEIVLEPTAVAFWHSRHTSHMR